MKSIKGYTCFFSLLLFPLNLVKAELSGIS